MTQTLNTPLEGKREPMSRLIDADALYEKTAEWEAQALHMVEVTMNEEDKTEWRRWNVILTERSAFKFDIADAPTIEPEQKRGEWKDRGEDYMIRWICSECGRKETHVYNFCPDCGADMRGGETDV